MTQIQIKRQDKFAIFWGGGLGDILTLRPLLLALVRGLDTPPYFFTTASHLTGLFAELGLNVNLQVLPRRPLAALRAIRQLGIRFDWLYLGPYPRLKTRLLAQAVGARHIWNERHRQADPFVGEQVVADVRALGLGDSEYAQPYGGRWLPPRVSMSPAASEKYLVLHPGVKEGWQTKQWPDAAWSILINNVLTATSMNLMLVGVPSEREHLEKLVEEANIHAPARVSIRSDLSLGELCHAIDASLGVICHNSGVLHLAAMLGKNTLSLTGSSPLHWRPPYHHIKNLSSGLCNLACDQYRCPVPFYRARCIVGLGVTEVLAALSEVVGVSLAGQR